MTKVREWMNESVAKQANSWRCTAAEKMVEVPYEAQNQQN